MAKKPTMMEMKEHVDMLTRQVNFQSRMMDSIGVAFSNYVKFNKNEEDFKEYLENNKNLHKLTKEESDDRKKGRINETGDVSTKKVRKEKNEKE
tara:strand:- start:269 stop:550 length:282 start_codon:yes stop_codon:yes gene_type:complete